MRCYCYKCENNENGYCGVPDGNVGIDENGECDALWIREKEEGAE